MPTTAPHAPHAPHSSTSRAAAEAIRPHLARLCTIVLGAITDAGADGLTREELEDITGIDGNTIRPRVKWLLDHQYIQLAVFQRQTKSKRSAEVLVRV